MAFENNSIRLIGNIGRDPDMNYTPSGTACTKFSLAVNRTTGKDPQGKWLTETEWFNIICWKQLAEQVSDPSVLKKGTRVQVEGRLSQRKYTDKNGNERISVEVIANSIWLGLPKPSGNGNQENRGNDDDLGELDYHPF